eukprot:266801-Chlamydomonas_euryale.AAC.6
MLNGGRMAHVRLLYGACAVTARRMTHLCLPASTFHEADAVAGHAVCMSLLMRIKPHGNTHSPRMHASIHPCMHASLSPSSCTCSGLLEWRPSSSRAVSSTTATHASTVRSTRHAAVAGFGSLACAPAPPAVATARPGLPCCRAAAAA